MNIDEAKTLIDHSEWADSLIWKSVQQLPKDDDELRSKFHHAHLVQWIYLQVWQGTPLQLRDPASFATLADMKDWVRAYYREVAAYMSQLSEPDLDRKVAFPLTEGIISRYGHIDPSSPLKDLLLQVVMHSAYHRGQLARRIRELGAEPPTTDYIAWVWLRRPAPAWD